MAEAMGAGDGPPVALHYRRRYLSRSETFIYEVVSRHVRYRPVVATHERLNAGEFPLPGDVRVGRGPGGRRVAGLVGWSDLLRIRHARAGLAPVARSVGPAVLHAHFGEEGVIAAGPSRRLGVPLIVTFYGFDAGRRGRQWLWRRRFRRLFGTASLVLAEGPQLRARLEALGCAPDRIRIQPIPIRLDRFPFEPRSRPDDGSVVVLQACRMVAKKGVDVTIRAFARVARERPRLRLWLLGDGPERDALVRLAEECGVRDRTRFLGMCSHDEYAAAVRRAHVFVHPSRTANDGDTEGGAPTVLLEAQASGMPIVATRHADIPYAVDADAALLADENDAAGVAASLEHLLRNPGEWKRRAEAGRRRVATRNDPARLVRMLEDAYDAARRRPAPAGHVPAGRAGAEGTG